MNTKSPANPMKLLLVLMLCILLPCNHVNARSRVNYVNPYLPNQLNAPPRAIDYAGYSKEFLTVKNLILDKNWQQAYDKENVKVTEPNTADFLNSNETGLIALDMGNPTAAIEHFAAAELYLKNNMERSLLEDSAYSYGGEFLSMLTGAGEITEYHGAPFERILMLNYKSISYLLNGERKAYNVTRRAIDWQNIEQKEFEKSLEETNAKIKQEKQKQAQTSTESTTPQTASTPNSTNIFKTIADQYKSSEKTALSVPSAYVNPFGFYMAGIVQELDAYEDASLRDNARISYQKALKLNPKSKVIRKALADVKKRPPRNRKLIHIIAANGFAPEKKRLQFALPMPGGIVPVKLPIYEPVESKVAHIRVKSGRRTLATLSTVADVEAIILRHQLDSLPFEHFKVLAAVARSTAENMLWQQMGVFGVIGKQLRESFAAPDMRGWMSLPKQLMAGRFYASKKVSKLTVVSYDKKWRRLASETVSIPKDSHGVIYIRSIDNLLSVSTNKPLWVKI